MRYEMVICPIGNVKTDYLIVDSADVAALFIGREIFTPKKWDDTTVYGWFSDPDYLDGMMLGFEEYLLGNKPFKVHKSVVKAVCEASGINFVFWFNNRKADYYNCLPEYGIKILMNSKYMCIKVNALTIGETIGSLKEFIAWYT